MQHSFDIDIAKDYGILEAVILNNMYFWIIKNKANNVNYYDGSYWTFNSSRAFSELFPYASQRQIQLALKKLIDEGILKTGNYNKSAYDRTLWYAFTQKGKCIMQKCKMDYTEEGNGLHENVQPIPDINTDINTNIDDEEDTIFDYLQKNGFILTPIHYEIIREWEDNELTRYAIQIAVLNNVYKISYIDKILYNFKVNNITTVEQAKTLKCKSNYQKIESDVPEWFDKELEVEEIDDETRRLIDEIKGA
jgi:DnaD/phage-associated family protein